MVGFLYDVTKQVIRLSKSNSDLVGKYLVTN